VRSTPGAVRGLGAGRFVRGGGGGDRGAAAPERPQARPAHRRRSALWGHDVAGLGYRLGMRNDETGGMSGAAGRFSDSTMRCTACLRSQGWTSDRAQGSRLRLSLVTSSMHASCLQQRSCQPAVVVRHLAKEWVGAFW